jgi:C-terminal processing protease CtpA/Prc
MATRLKITAAQNGVDYAACDDALRPHATKVRGDKKAAAPSRRSAAAREVLSGPFLAPGTLSRGERVRLLDGIERVMEGVYTHLPLKRARYGFDPLQRLRILRAQADTLSDQAFHLELADALARLRDAHTAYTGPRTLEDTTAVLPFRMEAAGPPTAPTYLVTHVVKHRLRRIDRRFRPGVQVVSWNGVPIDRAVERWSETTWGGRADTRRVAALQSMTLRPLRFGPPPDEHWVIVGYRRVDERGRVTGPVLEQRFDWRIVRPALVQDAYGAPRGRRGARRAAVRAGAPALRRALNPAAETMRRATMLLFAPHALATRPVRDVRGGFPRSKLPTFFKVEPLSTAHGDVPLLRIYSFNIDSDDDFIAELERVLRRLPADGLIIDIRDNPGGYIWAAERALQMFTDRPIEPTLFSVLATPFTRTAAATAGLGKSELGPWRASLDAAVRNGELYSRALPITPPELCNAIGRVYPGPSLLVTNANTYSSGDLFSAGFMDNAIGPVICVGLATAGGGANVLEYTDLVGALAGTPMALPRLPEGIGLSLSFRRATRNGPSLGLPIEDVGVEGHEVYAMTRDDVLHGNRDLYARCAATLAALRK